MNVIRGRVRYPHDFDSLHRDDQDEFRRSRYAIGDTLLDASGGQSLHWLLWQPDGVRINRSPPLHPATEVLAHVQAAQNTEVVVPKFL